MNTAPKLHIETLREMFAVCANERRMKEADAINAAISALAPPSGEGVEPSKVTHDAALAQALREACALYESQGKDIEHCDVCIGVLLGRTREILRTAATPQSAPEE